MNFKDICDVVLVELSPDVRKNKKTPTQIAKGLVKYYEEKYDMTLDVDPELLEPNSLDEEEKESLSIEDVSEKYKINKNLVNTLISKKPKRGPVEVQKPFREDPIDLITDQMLADSGYIDSIYAGALPKALAKRKFIKDFYNDLGN